MMRLKRDALANALSPDDLTPGSGRQTFHVRRLKGSVDSVHTLDRDEVLADMDEVTSIRD